MKKIAQHTVLWTIIAGIGVALLGCPPNAYNTLTLSITPPRAGEILVDPNLSQYPPRAEVTLEAIPAEGWVFSNWIGSGFNTSTATTKLIMNSDKAVTAVFSPEFEDEGEDEQEGEEEGEDAGELPASKVQDGGFEQGPDSLAWTQTSTLYETIICNEVRCGMLEGLGARSGEYWAYFGALDGSAETAQLEQTLTMPARDIASLWLYIAVPVAEVGFQFQISIIPDGSPLESAVLFEINETHASLFSDYQMVEVDASSYADGRTYTLRFNFTSDTDNSDTRAAIFVDDVSVTSDK